MANKPPKTKVVKLTDLIPDDQNFNKGTEFGNHLIDKSLTENGAGRGLLVDKDNKIIAGNKTVENAIAAGFTEVVLVETDGKQFVAAQRTDLELDSPEGRTMAIADNATAKANIEWDMEALSQLDLNWGIEPKKDWGINVDWLIPEEEDEATAIETISKAQELQKKWKTKKGQLWQLGDHRIYKQDSGYKTELRPYLVEKDGSRFKWKQMPFKLRKPVPVAV